MIVAQPSLLTRPCPSSSNLLPRLVPKLAWSPQALPSVSPTGPCRNPRFLSRLRTLELSCSPFCIRCLLFSMVCALFDKNTGLRVHVSASSASMIRFAFDFDRLCFHNLTNPFSRNPFIFTSIQNPRGVAPSTPPFHRSPVTNHKSLLFAIMLSSEGIHP